MKSPSLISKTIRQIDIWLDAFFRLIKYLILFSVPQYVGISTYIFKIYKMGSFRSTPDNIKHSYKDKDVINGQLSFQVVHMCGWRIYMQDAHISVSPMANAAHSIFGVFDGHGGAQVSTFVERHFVRELQANDTYKKAKAPEDFERALKQTFIKMDDILLSEAGRTEIKAIQKQMRQKDNGPKYQEESHAGCTANVVLITPDWIICANAGDSRAVACVGGKAQQLSVDHKPQDKIELDRITKAGGAVNFGRVNGGLNLSRAIGDFEYKSKDKKKEEQMITCVPDFKRIRNENVDFIIMGCDGIWQVKSNQQMVNWVKAKIDNANRDILLKSTLQDLLEQLVSKDSGNQYGMDNMSSILIRFNRKK